MEISRWGMDVRSKTGGIGRGIAMKAFVGHVSIIEAVTCVQIIM